MFARTLGAMAFAVGFAASAWADGMPEYSRVYAPALSWTGFYIGANVGWERKRMVGSDYDLVNTKGASPGDFNQLITDGFSTAAPTSQNLQGSIGGGQIGYNHQFGRAVIGTELSASWNDVTGSGDCFRQGLVGTIPLPTVTNTSTRNCSERQKWSVNWLNKFGVTTGPLLVYLTGGVAVTQIDIKRSLDFRTVATGGPLAGATLEHDTAAWSGEQTHVGVVLGAGMQYALGHNVSLGVEYLRTTYANADYLTQGTGTTIIGTVAPAPTKFNFSANAIENGYSDTIRAVLNYKFGDYERGPLK